MAPPPNAHAVKLIIYVISAGVYNLLEPNSYGEIQQRLLCNTYCRAAMPHYVLHDYVLWHCRCGTACSTPILGLARHLWVQELLFLTHSVTARSDILGRARRLWVQELLLLTHSVTAPSESFLSTYISILPSLDVDLSYLSMSDTSRLLVSDIVDLVSHLVSDL